MALVFCLCLTKFVMLSCGMTKLLTTVHCRPLCQCMFASACITTEMLQTVNASSTNKTDSDSCLFTELCLVVLCWDCSVSAQESVTSQRSFYVATMLPCWTARARVQSKASFPTKALLWPTTQRSVSFAGLQFTAAPRIC